MKHRKVFSILFLLVVIAAAAYLLVDVRFDNPKLFRYAMRLRIPKLAP